MMNVAASLIRGAGRLAAPIVQLQASLAVNAHRYIAANHKKSCMDGNSAAAHVAYAASDMVVLYPITPSSSAAEVCDEWASRGRKNIFGQVVDVKQMQSEAGVAGALHGALMAGGLATTFTTSQGFLLMIPNMFKIAGEKFPAVFHVPSRTVQTHGGSMHGDFSDVFTARSTGLAYLCSGSVQEVMDSACIAHMAALKGSYPFIHFYEGFHVSHQINTLEALPYEQIKELMDFNAIKKHRDRSLHPTNPSIRGVAMGNDICFQATESGLRHVDALPEIVQGQMDKFAAATGRRYKLFDYYGAHDAENIVIVMGAGGVTVESTVTELVKRGEKVGVVRVRLWRPFSVEHFIKSLPSTVKRICVLDRTREALAVGDPLHEDVASALMSANMGDVKVIGGRYGFGGCDFTPAMVAGIFDNLKKSEPKNRFTVGIVDDVRHTSLSYPPESTIDVVPKGTKECVFWGFAGDGTIGANHTALHLLTENTHLHGQGDFTYDPHKTGGVTTSHLRFGEQKIDAPFLTINQDFVACHKAVFANQYPEEMLDTIRDGGIFVLNCPYKTTEELDAFLCPEMKSRIAKKKLKMYVIDAHKIARMSGLQSGQISNVMQAVFFHLSHVLPSEQATKLLKDAIAEQFKKKGKEVIKSNQKSVDDAVAELTEVKIPESWAKLAGAEIKDIDVHSEAVHAKPVPTAFGRVQPAPPDALLNITVRFNKCKDPRKVSLGVGAYRDAEGKPVVFKAVQEAEKRFAKYGTSRNEYAGIDGVSSFYTKAAELVFGSNDKGLHDGSIASVQTVAGSGSVRLGADFLVGCYPWTNPSRKTMYVPNPTWVNHIPLISTAGCTISQYRYYSPKTRTLDEQGMLEDWANLPRESVVLVHPCAHNPTGCDPSHAMWDRLAALAKERNLMTFFDCAYQGFASRDMEDDAYAIRKFRESGVNMIVGQSFSKSMGLYGQRVGALHVCTSNAKEADNVKSNLMVMIRKLYSIPPAYGAYLASEVLNDPELKAMWKTELAASVGRLIDARGLLAKELKALGGKHDWSCLTNTKGMFCYTGLNPAQIGELEHKHHVFMAGDGRISVVGLSEANVKHVAAAFHAVAH